MAERSDHVVTSRQLHNQEHIIAARKVSSYVKSVKEYTSADLRFTHMVGVIPKAAHSHPHRHSPKLTPTPQPTLALTHTHTLALTPTLSPAHPHTCTHTHVHTLAPSPTPTHTLAFTPTLSHSHQLLLTCTPTSLTLHPLSCTPSTHIRTCTQHAFGGHSLTPVQLRAELLSQLQEASRNDWHSCHGSF